MAFASIDHEALLVMNQKLTPMEFQVFSVYKMEEFFGGGACKLNCRQIKDKYNFQNYDNLTVVRKDLIQMNWLIETKAGIKCQDDFSKVIDKTPKPKKTAKPRTTQKILPQNSDETENFQVNDEKELRNSKDLTENFQVKDLEIPSKNAPSKEYKSSTLETGKEQVFAEPHTSFAEGESGSEIFLPSKIPKAQNGNHRKKIKTPRFKKPRKSDKEFEQLARLCFLKQTPAELRNLSGKERGQLNQNLKKLRDSDYDLTRLGEFETWWKTNWRSGTEKDLYEPPRPDQVATYWNVAMSFEQIIEAVKTSKVKPVWVTVGQSQVDVSNGSGAPQPLDTSGKSEALDFFRHEPADILGDLNEWRKWYTAEDWAWLMDQLKE